MSNIEKFNYLRTFFEGPAAAAIDGLSLMNGNYVIAVDLLHDRYGNKQLIISSHMDSMLNLHRVTVATDGLRIRMVYDKIEMNVHSLQALGVKSEMYGSLLIPVIMDKIPEEFRLIISRKMKLETWDITELVAVFKEELEAREKSRFVGGNSSSVEEKPWLKGRRSYDPVTAAALHLTDQPQASCYFCDHPGHKTFKCSLVTDPETRKEILKKKGKCFVCLKSEHILKYCPSEMRYIKCSGKHHSSVCKRSFQLQFMGTNGVRQQNTNERGGEASTTDQNPGATPTLHVNAKRSVLLQMATANVSNPRSLRSMKARLILDNGSQRSYISNRIREALELPSLHSKNVLIKTFGSVAGQQKKCDVVQFCVSKTGGGLNLYLNAYAVPNICSPLSQQKIEFAKVVRISLFPGNGRQHNRWYRDAN